MTYTWEIVSENASELTEHQTQAVIILFNAIYHLEQEHITATKIYRFTDRYVVFTEEFPETIVGTKI